MWKIFASVGDIQSFEIIEVQPGLLAYIEVDPSEAALNISETVYFSAVGYDSDGNIVYLDPQWISSGGGTIHTSGIFTASTPGTWTVYCNYSGVSGEAAVTVNSPEVVDDDDDDIGPDDDDDTGDKGSMIGPVLGIIGALILLLIVGAVIYFVVIRKKETPPEPAPEPPAPETTEQDPYQDLYGQQPTPQEEPMAAPVDQGQIPPPIEQPMPEQYQQVYDQGPVQPDPSEPVPDEAGAVEENIQEPAPVEQEPQEIVEPTLQEEIPEETPQV